MSGSTANWVMLRTPPEVRWMVYSQLDWGAAIALSQTCRFFYDEVRPDQWSAAAKHQFLARAERFRRYAAKPPFSHFNAYYACYDCCRILPRDCFTDSTLGDDGAAQACVASKEHLDHDDCAAQGPLLPGDRWSRVARSYTTVQHQCAFSIRNRRTCFRCQLKRGGWWAGQSLILRGITHHFCVACQNMQCGLFCYHCYTCHACMQAGATSPLFPPCAHTVVMNSIAQCQVNDRYVELMRRGLVHFVATQRTGIDKFLDVVFDKELEKMPPYIKPSVEARSITDVGDKIVALDERRGPDKDEGGPGSPEWAKMPIAARG